MSIIDFCYILVRMNESLAGLWQGLLAILTDPTFLSAVGSLILVIAATLSRNFKEWVSKQLKKWKRSKRLKELESHAIPSNYLQMGMQINERLDRLREELDCSRVAILQFRNGTNFTLSSPMFRVYGSFESLRPGIRPSSDYFSERLGTTILELLGPVLGPTPTLGQGTSVLDHKCTRTITCPIQHNHPRVVKYATESLPYCTLRYMLEEAGVRTMYGVPIKSDNNTIGILVIHYLVDFDATEKIESNMCLICDTVQRIQGMLDIRKQNA